MSNDDRNNVFAFPPIGRFAEGNPKAASGQPAPADLEIQPAEIVQQNPQPVPEIPAPALTPALQAVIDKVRAALDNRNTGPFIELIKKNKNDPEIMTLAVGNLLEAGINFILDKKQFTAFTELQEIFEAGDFQKKHRDLAVRFAAARNNRGLFVLTDRAVQEYMARVKAAPSAISNHSFILSANPPEKRHSERDYFRVRFQTYPSLEIGDSKSNNSLEVAIAKDTAIPSRNRGIFLTMVFQLLSEAAVYADLRSDEDTQKYALDCIEDLLIMAKRNKIPINVKNKVFRKLAEDPVRLRAILQYPHQETLHMLLWDAKDKIMKLTSAFYVESQIASALCKSNSSLALDQSLERMRAIVKQPLETTEETPFEPLNVYLREIIEKLQQAPKSQEQDAVPSASNRKMLVYLLCDIAERASKPASMNAHNYTFCAHQIEQIMVNPHFIGHHVIDTNLAGRCRKIIDGTKTLKSSPVVQHTDHQPIAPTGRNYGTGKDGEMLDIDAGLLEEDSFRPTGAPSFLGPKTPSQG